MLPISVELRLSLLRLCIIIITIIIVSIIISLSLLIFCLNNYNDVRTWMATLLVAAITIIIAIIIIEYVIVLTIITSNSVTLYYINHSYFLYHPND